MTKQEVVDKLRQLATQVETIQTGSIATWTDFELEMLVIVGRPDKDKPFSPVFVFDTDLTAPHEICECSFPSGDIMQTAPFLCADCKKEIPGQKLNIDLVESDKAHIDELAKRIRNTRPKGLMGK